MDMPDETNLTAILRRRIADAILDAAGDAIIACDADGIIRFWKLGASRIFGFDAGEAVGQSLDIIILERIRTRHWEGFNKMVVTEQSRAVIRKVTSCRYMRGVKMDRKSRSNSRPLRLRKVAEL